MKTDELVSMLAAGDVAMPSGTVSRRLALGLGVGVAGAVVLMAIALGPRHDLAMAAQLPMFWVKLGFAAAMAVAGVTLVNRLARPGAKLAHAPLAVAVPVLVLWTGAAVVLANAAPGEREALFFGHTWNSCPWLIAALSVPVFVMSVWTMRGLAPTDLRAAGAAIGFVSGAFAALVYSLHCPEQGAPFIAFWYLLGMLIPTAVGTLLGPRLLRW